MKTAAWIILGLSIGFAVAFTCRLPHDQPKLKRWQHYLRMRGKGVVYDKPVDDPRSSIRSHNLIIGRKA